MSCFLLAYPVSVSSILKWHKLNVCSSISCISTTPPTSDAQQESSAAFVWVALFSLSERWSVGLCETKLSGNNNSEKRLWLNKLGNTWRPIHTIPCRLNTSRQKQWGGLSSQPWLDVEETCVVTEKTSEPVTALYISIPPMKASVKRTWSVIQGLVASVQREKERERERERERDKKQESKRNQQRKESGCRASRNLPCGRQEKNIHKHYFPSLKGTHWNKQDINTLSLRDGTVHRPIPYLVRECTVHRTIPLLLRDCKSMDQNHFSKDRVCQVKR